MDSITSLDSLQKSLSGDATKSVTAVQDQVVNQVVSQLSHILMWIVVPSIILTILVIVVYIIRVFRRHRVEHAIIEIRDILRTMQRSQGLSQTIPQPSGFQGAHHDDKTIPTIPIDRPKF